MGDLVYVGFIWGDNRSVRLLLYWKHAGVCYHYDMRRGILHLSISCSTVKTL
jgi:hypothetical protein